MTPKEQALRDYIETDTVGQEAQSLPLVYLADLLAETAEDTRYVWEGVLPLGGLSDYLKTLLSERKTLRQAQHERKRELIPLVVSLSNHVLR